MKISKQKMAETLWRRATEEGWDLDVDKVLDVLSDPDEKTTSSEPAVCSVCGVSFVADDKTLIFAKLNAARTAVEELEFYCNETCARFAQSARDALRSPK